MQFPASSAKVDNQSKWAAGFITSSTGIAAYTTSGLTKREAWSSSSVQRSSIQNLRGKLHLCLAGSVCTS